MKHGQILPKLDLEQDAQSHRSVFCQKLVQNVERRVNIYLCQSSRLASRGSVDALLDELDFVILEDNEFENRELYLLKSFWSFVACQ